MKNFSKLKNPSSWRRLSIATWKAPNDPTVYGSLSFNATKSLQFLEQLNKNSEVKITMTHLVAKVIALVLKKYSDINGIIRWRKIYLRKTVDLFLQVAIESLNENERPDLSGAKIEACEDKTITQIALELRQKSCQIRDKKDPQFKKTNNILKYIPSFFLAWMIRLLEFIIHDLGLSFPKLGLPADPFGSAMITSVGPLGAPAGYGPLVPLSRTPIILCVGTIEQRPWVVENQVIPCPVLEVKITFDHRFMDGVVGAKMAKFFKEIMNDPQKFLS